MLFPTLSFAAFFAVVLPVSWLLMPNRVRWRLFMVAASWMFYGAADWRFVPLLAGSTVLNHYFARRIDRARGQSRKTWTVAAVATNLAVLAWFKYIGFLSLSAQSSLRFLGFHGHVPLPEVLLPIGISFFTFQALSYVIDTSRGKIQPVSLLEFAVYLSFFPHLVAGPIVRATEFLPQIKERISPHHVDVGKAFWLISLGLFKKVVIASYLGTYAADPLFGFPRQHAGVEALFGVYAYAIQIYADFSGYTDIAIGLALLLGIQFPQNFNAPYSAASLQDFWRRWHMTLSRWLRDYLYIPLGGSRRGRVRTYVNIMITMLLGGLWHGAAWTFVAWGALHGTGLVVERWRGERRSASAARDPAAPGKDSEKGAAPVAVAPSALRPRVVTLFRGGRVAAGSVATVAAPTDTEEPNGRPSHLDSSPPRDPRVPGSHWARPRLSTARSATRAASGSGSAPPTAGLTLPPPGAEAAASAGTDAEPGGPAPPAPGSAPESAESAPPAPASAPESAESAPPAPASAPESAESAAPPPASAPPPARGPTDAPGSPGRQGARGAGLEWPELSPRARVWVGRLITFHVVCLAWIFFRATSFHNAVEVLGRIATLGGRHNAFNWKVAAVIVGALAVQLGPRGLGTRLQVLFSRSSFWLQALILAGVLTVVDLLGPAGVAPFIYFRF